MFNSNYTLLNKQKNSKLRNQKWGSMMSMLIFKKKQWVDPHNKAIKQATHDVMARARSFAAKIQTSPLNRLVSWRWNQQRFSHAFLREPAKLFGMWRSTDQLLFPNHAVEGVSPETRRQSVEMRRSMALWKKKGACVPTMRWAPKNGLLGKVEGPLTPGTSDRLRSRIF